MSVRPKIFYQTVLLSKPSQALAKSVSHSLSNPSSKLSCFQVYERSSLNNLKVQWVLVVSSVQINSMVNSLEPCSFTTHALFHPKILNAVWN